MSFWELKDLEMDCFAHPFHSEGLHLKMIKLQCDTALNDTLATEGVNKFDQYQSMPI